ncbi:MULTISPECIES: 5-formyltetrahydrofolate cyclo-ligase [Lactobacillus]|nr:MULTISPECIES: 5-formyltetrahydrofolate cyclo-ligase [Lactobacillus]
MKKTEMRKEQKQVLTTFADTPQKKKEDQAILRQLFTLDLIKKSQTIGVTSSLPIEIDTSEIIAQLWDLGKEVYLARANPDRAHTQDFLRYTYRSKLTKSKFGVEEVAGEAEIKNDLDLLIVPGLAFSQDNHARLGFGGGYYDRFLAKHPTKTIALANSKMIFETATWPIEATDVAMDVIVTPNKIYR